MQVIGKVLIVALLLLQCGCAIIRASKRPLARPPYELVAGMPYHEIDERYGYPVAIGRNEAGEYTEQLQFIDGVSPENKGTWIAVHAGLDFETFFIWELFGLIVEASRDRVYPIHHYYLVYRRDGRLLRTVDAKSEEGEAYNRLPWVKQFNPKLKLNLDNSVRKESPFPLVLPEEP